MDMNSRTPITKKIDKHEILTLSRATLNDVRFQVIISQISIASNSVCIYEFEFDRSSWTTCMYTSIYLPLLCVLLVKFLHGPFAHDVYVKSYIARAASVTKQSTRGSDLISCVKFAAAPFRVGPLLFSTCKPFLCRTWYLNLYDAASFCCCCVPHLFFWLSFLD